MTSYPLVMAQKYFKTHQGIDPKLIQRSNDMLEKAYKRLTGYECKQGGYEWFGGDPGHEGKQWEPLLFLNPSVSSHCIRSITIRRYELRVSCRQSNAGKNYQMVTESSRFQWRISPKL